MVLRCQLLKIFISQRTDLYRKMCLKINWWPIGTQWNGSQILISVFTGSKIFLFQFNVKLFKFTVRYDLSIERHYLTIQNCWSWTVILILCWANRVMIYNQNCFKNIGIRTAISPVDRIKIPIVSVEVFHFKRTGNTVINSILKIFENNWSLDTRIPSARFSRKRFSPGLHPAIFRRKISHRENKNVRHLGIRPRFSDDAMSNGVTECS